MEAEYEGLKPDKRGSYLGALKVELRKLRKAGVAHAPLNDAPNICQIAHQVTLGGEPREEVEALLDLAIKRKFANLPSRQEEMRLTLGLDDDTRNATSDERHKAAWKRHLRAEGEGGPFDYGHYVKNKTGEYRDKLANELLDVFREHQETPAAAVDAPKPAAAGDGTAEAVTADAASSPRDQPSEAPEGSAPEQSGQVPKRRLVAAVLAVAIVLAVLLLAVDPFGSDTAATDQGPSLRRLATEDNRLLAVDRTPLPGEASRTLGYGDEVGGRKMYAYAGNRNYTTVTPTLDSIDDAPSQYPNGRKFVHVLIVSRKHIHHVLSHEEPRSAVLPLEEDKLASVRVWIENSAAVLGPCHSRQPTTAAEVKLRIAIWESPDHTLHVVRAWLSSRNTDPRWITDAVAVKTPQPARLVLVPALSTYWLEQTGDRYPFPAVNAFKPAGVAIGVDGTGRIGSCWREDLNYNLVFRPKAVTH